MVKNCVLLITGCMTPYDGIFALKLTDSEARKQQYIESIRYYITSTPFEKIIYCDNSNAVLQTELMELAIKHSKQLEWLSFTGDKEKVLEKGKGYGEGEIIEYALTHSKLLQESVYMVKITGRLIVKNIRFLLKFANESGIYFVPALTEGGKLWIETRLYMMPIQIYRKYFLDAYNRVDDRNGLCLEQIFASVIQDNCIPYRNWVVMPDFRGISGTFGTVQDLPFVRRVKKTCGMYLRRKY